MKRKQLWFQAAAVLIACAAAWPLISAPGLLNTRGGGDSPFLLQRLHQLETALRDGHFPVRWMPDANYGYGYPFFNYYAPLAFYVAAGFRRLGFSIVRAIQLSQVLAFLGAGWGMYQLAWRWLRCNQRRAWAALLTSAAYTLAPFHLANVYVRGDSIAEFWAMAFYPLVIWAVDSVAANSPKRPLAYITRGWPLALAYAGLILSHNISAMIFSPFVLLYALYKLWRSRRVKDRKPSTPSGRQQMLVLAVALLLGLALSAWFWLPAIGEQALTQLDSVTEGYFSYARHFRGTDLIQSSFFYAPDVSRGLAFRMGLVQALLIAAGLSLPALRKVAPRAFSALPHVDSALPLSFILVGFGVATFMLTPLSRPLWDTLPLLPFTQFPWRFLSIQAFFGAMIIGLISPTITGIKRLPAGVHPLLVTAVVGLMLLSSLGGLRVDHLLLTDRDITAEALVQYEWFTGNIGTTVSAEYLPPVVEPRPYASAWLVTGERQRANVVAGEATAALQDARTQRQTWQVTVTSDAATLVLPTLYWQGWQAHEQTGGPLALEAAPGSGLIQLTLPKGDHQIALQLARTPLRRTAEILSLATLVIILLCIVYTAVRPNRQPHSTSYAARALLPLALALGLVSLFMLIERPAAYTPDTLTWDFGEMGYLHHQPDGISYGNGARLGGYALSAETISAGDTLDVTLNWLAQPAGETRMARLELITPAINRFGRVAPVAFQLQPLEKGIVSYQLAIPENAPPGLYVPTLWLSDDNRPRTPAGRLRADTLALRPVRVVPARTPAVETKPHPGVPLQLETLNVVQRTQNIVDVRLAWWTEHARAQNLQVSLRLTTPGGQEIFPAQFDTQPGYGFLPSTSWPPGTWTHDWLALFLPDEMPFEPPYVLVAQLYEKTSGQSRLTRRLGEFTRGANGRLVFQPSQPVYALPDRITPLNATFQTPEGTGVIALRGYTLEETEDALDVTLYWEALAPAPADYRHFVHLLDPATGTPARQHDAMPRNNTYPTTQWAQGEVVADRLKLDLHALPADTYPLTVGLYEIVADNYPRLTAVGPAGEAFENNSVPLINVKVGE